MPNINQVELDALQKEILDQWDEAFRSPPQEQLNKLATFYKSNRAQGHYFFLEAFGAWRKWVGARKFKDMASQDFSLKNDTFECSFSLNAEVYKDDGIGAYSGVVSNMLDGYYKKRTMMIYDLLVQNTALAYDGAVLFGTTRTYDGTNTISNTVATALSVTTFDAAMQTMMSYKDADGEPLYVRPNLLVVGPKLMRTAADIVGNKYITDGATSSVQIENFYSTLGVQLLVSPHLVGAYDDYWFLADVSGGVNGVIFQDRELLPPIVSNQQEVMRSNQIDFLGSARMAVAPGAPHKIYLGGTGV